MKIVYVKIIILLSISTLLMISCEDIIDSNIVSPEDSAAAALLANDANASLLVLIGDVLVANPDSAQDIINLINFSGVNDLYAQSYDLDYRNKDVKFGLAFTSAMILSQNTNLNEILGSDLRVYQPITEVDDSTPTSGFGFGLPLSINRVNGMIAQYFEIPIALSRLEFENLVAFNDFQNEARNFLIPMIDAGLSALDSLSNYPDFTFDLSDNVQIDIIDITALEASLYALQGIFNTIAVYNFELVTTDSAGIVDGLSSGSNFATLGTDGALVIGAALESAFNSIDRVKSVLDILQPLSSTHDNFLSDFSQVMIPETRNDLDALLVLLEQSASIQYGHVTEDGAGSVDGTFQIDISQYYSNPVTDLKSLLPAYTIGTTTAYNYNFVSLTEAVNVEQTEVLVANLNNTPVRINIAYSESNNDTVARVTLGPFTYNLLTANQNILPVAVWELWDVFVGLIDEYSDELYNFPELSFQWEGVITSGQSFVIDGTVAIDYQERISSYIAPELLWGASTPDAWLLEWQNPTVNGMFPNFAATDLSNLLGITWE
ncbi:MAG: hypothetical protein HQ507_00050 [Candidatus Marinimicrobia bacterium]|nr:hypothetical protein [Candidatus Neomarinimicrobiota bacterium]